jgi:hypothetical protein
MRCCERLVPSAGTAQDGEAWTCPKCGRKWVHVCDEAEGCCWEPDVEAEVMAMARGPAIAVGQQRERQRTKGRP